MRYLKIFLRRYRLNVSNTQNLCVGNIYITPNIYKKFSKVFSKIYRKILLKTFYIIYFLK